MKSKHRARLTENSCLYLSHCTCPTLQKHGQSCFPQIYPKISNLVICIESAAHTQSLVARGSPWSCLCMVSSQFLFRLQMYLEGADGNYNRDVKPFQAFTFAPTLVYLKMNKNINGWVIDSSTYSTSSMILCFSSSVTFLFILAKVKGQRGKAWIENLLRMLRKEIPKFLSCLNVVKLTVQKLNHFWAFLRTNRLSENQEIVTSSSKPLYAINVFSCRGNYPKEKKVMSLCHRRPRHNWIDFLRKKNNSSILSATEFGEWIKHVSLG